jgi:hypothetical protein
MLRYGEWDRLGIKPLPGVGIRKDGNNLWATEGLICLISSHIQGGNTLTEFVSSTECSISGAVWNDGLILDGSNDYIDIPDKTIYTPDILTVSVVVDITTTPDQYDTLVSHSNSQGWGYRLWNFGGSWAFRLYSSSVNGHAISQAGTASSGKSTLVGRYTGSYLSLHKNGNQIAGIPYSLGYDKGSYQFRIGSWHDSSRACPGKFDIFSLYSTAKTDEEILKLYESPYAMFEPWNFNRVFSIPSTPPTPNSPGISGGCSNLFIDGSPFGGNYVNC